MQCNTAPLPRLDLLVRCAVAFSSRLQLYVCRRKARLLSQPACARTVGCLAHGAVALSYPCKRVRRRAGAWALLDAGSLNGSLLNGAVISRAHRAPGTEQQLSHGDVVELGSASKVRLG